jgi:uncharacterized protein
LRAGGDGNFWEESKGLIPENVERTLLTAAFDLEVVIGCYTIKDKIKNKIKGSGQECPLHNFSMVGIHSSAGFVRFAVKVHPRAKKNGITGKVGDALKLSLTAPPADGKANEACIEFFAKLLEVPRSSVSIAAGQTRRNKVIRVAGLSAQRVRERLGI